MGLTVSMTGLRRRQDLNLGRFKPGVGQRIHVLFAAALWSGIGIFLIVRGIILLKSGHGLWLIGAGLLIGTIKSHVILDRSAQRTIVRIHCFADNTCIGAVYSWRTWLLVLAMAVGGMFIRRAGVEPRLIGTVLTAIGWALIYSSRHAWLAWLRWEGGS